MRDFLLYILTLCAVRTTVSFNVVRRPNEIEILSLNSLGSSARQEPIIDLVMNKENLHSLPAQQAEDLGHLKNTSQAKIYCDELDTSDDEKCVRSLSFKQPKAIDNLSSQGETILTVTEKDSVRTMLVCQPQTKQLCEDSASNIGACYIQNVDKEQWNNNQIQNWRSLLPCWQSCYKNVVDLAFVIDGSRSINKRNFKQVLTWITDIATAFNISSDYRIAVVRYARRENTEVEIQLGQYTDHASFQKGVMNVTYKRPGGTMSSYAINVTVDQVFKGPFGRFPHARRVMIFLTDGKSDDARFLKSSANYARRNFVESFAVGIADYQTQELLEIAGNPERVFKEKNFESLANTITKIQEEIRKLEGEACLEGRKCTLLNNMIQLPYSIFSQE